MVMVHTRLITLLLLGLVMLQQAAAVKDYLFKKCDQSSFCHRNRHFASSARNSSFESQYAVDPESIKYDLIHSSFRGNIAKKLNDGSSVTLPFELNILQDNNVRLRVDELQRVQGDIAVDDARLAKRRFNEAYKYALKNHGRDLKSLDDDVELKYEKFDGRTVIDYGADLEYQLVLQYAPFKLTLSLDKSPVLVLNDANFMNVEHWRPHVENDTVNLSPYESDFNMFEDNFKDSKGDRLPFGPESIAMDVTFHGINHVYGLSEHASQDLQLHDTVNSDRDPYRLYNVDIFEYEDESQFPMYGSVPFVMGTSEKYSAGFFWINGADTYIDVDKSAEVSAQPGASQQQVLQADAKTSTLTHWISENGIIDLILIVDKKPQDINKKYGDLVGNAPLPALFSLGYHQCRWNYNDELDVLDIHSKFDVHNISYDTIWLDIEYTDSKKYFTWKDELFPDPMEMLSQLDETGRNLVAIIDPHIKTGYAVSDAIEAKSLGIQNSDNGKTYHGHCWPGESVWIDTLNPEAVQYWASLFANSTANAFIGTSSNLHLWNDMNEPSVFNGPETSAPKDLVHYGGWEHRSVHNIYGLTFHEATYAALVERNPNQRPFILTRSFYAGSQRTAAMWTGDNMSKWEYLRLSIPMNMNQGIVNFIFSGSDVGGFFGNPSKELLARWYQAGLWYPFFRGHAHIDSRRREPWVAGGEYTDVMRDAIDLRYKLLPAFYTAFYENAVSGLPFLKPTFYEAPQSEKAHTVSDQFFVSDTGLLVKPITDEGATETTVYFPDGADYFDFHTHKLVSSQEQVYTVTDVSLHTLPLFYKSGHVIATKERHRRSSKLQNFDPYTLTVVLDRDGHAQGKLYIDDGVSFDYESGEFAVASFKADGGFLVSDVRYGVQGSKLQQFLSHIQVERIVVISANADDVVIKRPDVSIGENWEIALSI